MAITITTTNLAEIKEIAVGLLNKADETKDIEARKVFESDLDYTISYYNSNAKNECYQKAKESGDPMRYAVLTFWYDGIKVQDHKDNDTGIVTRSIEVSKKPIDLADLHKRQNGIGADHRWIYTAERFNSELTARAATRYNAVAMKELLKNKDSFTMNEIAKGIDLGKNPVCEKNLLATLTLVVSQMIGAEYKPNQYDVNYLMDVYASDSKKSRTHVTAANHKTLRGYLKKVCYRILTNGVGYDVEQREIKVEKA